MLFISLFNHIFGDANSPVGITTVIAVLILMSENLTVSPIKNFMKLLLINIIIGMEAFIASQNIYWGVIIDFSKSLLCFKIKSSYCNNSFYKWKIYIT